MLKPLLNILVAGTIGFLSIIGVGLVVALHNDWFPAAVSNTTLIAGMLIPIPIGLLIAWAVYRGLDRITASRSKQPR